MLAYLSNGLADRMVKSLHFALHFIATTAQRNHYFREYVERGFIIYRWHATLVCMWLYDGVIAHTLLEYGSLHIRQVVGFTSKSDKHSSYTYSGAYNNFHEYLYLNIWRNEGHLWHRECAPGICGRLWWCFEITFLINCTAQRQLFRNMLSQRCNVH